MKKNLKVTMKNAMKGSKEDRRILKNLEVDSENKNFIKEKFELVIAKK